MYKDILIKGLIFVIGTVAGSAVTYKFVKDKYEKITNEEIAAMREHFEEKYNQPTFNEASNYEPTDADAEKLKDILLNNGYESKSEKEENKEGEDMYVPEVIAPEESWEQDYPTITLTYYEGDGVLTDDHDKIITNADELVGQDFAQHFGEYEEDSVYIRNSKLKVHYEILRDYGAYSDRMCASE